MFKRGEREREFSLEKADVFSLGMTIFLMITMKNTTALNFKDSNKLLLKKIIELTDVDGWVILVLTGLLQADSKERFSFKKCLQYLPRDSRSYVATIKN